MNIAILLILFFLVTPIPQALAEESESTNVTEDDYMGEVPTVLTVSRMSQPLADAPSAVTVIDRDTIRAAGIVDLPEIFRLVPGFYVAKNAGYFFNTNHVVSYHGMTSAYAGAMQVLINGRSVYSPLFGGVQWSELPLAIADIDRIEITRGPNAASYGANSYFGVINIITQQPVEAQGNTIIATHGNGRDEVFYRYGGKWDDLTYRLTAGYRADSGLDRRNDFKRTNLLNAAADYQLDNNNSLEFEFGLADGDRGEGNINEDNAVFLPRTKAINNHYELVRWRNHISDDSDFSLQAYHSFDRSDDQTTSVNLRPVADALIGPGFGALLLNDTITIRNPVETERYDIEAQHNFAVTHNLRAVWGGSIRRDSMYAPYFLGTRKKDYFDLQRLFGNAEWHASSKVVFNAGAMLEHNDFTDTDISPRASINFKLTPQHTLRFGASSALRTPNYTEEKFNRAIKIPTIDPNQTLLLQQDAALGHVNPEKIFSREIGYLGNFGLGALGDLSVDARLFYDKITDHIRTVDRVNFPQPPGFLLISQNDISTAINDGSASVNGFETQIKWKLAKSTDLLMNYAHVNINELKPKLKRNYTQSMASNTFSALLTHRFNTDWDASLAYYQVGKVTALGDGDPVDLIRRCDIRVARAFRSGAWNGEISAVVENLFDDDYQEFADYNVAKRSAWLNVKLSF